MKQLRYGGGCFDDLVPFSFDSAMGDLPNMQTLLLDHIYNGGDFFFFSFSRFYNGGARLLRRQGMHGMMPMPNFFRLVDD